ncbi:hypothetical protein [Roseospira navarrensis]|uniref:Uncharacterized protein n=1 Tax=Roseospira navarrensis TaxID=140058 RepID=A0A7X1ZE32_9PROT|nr:hypothetical protein [Roseospira navarrensis]MQX36806.1 hypothetical protein [Roseospira navarrensis]
MDYVVPIDPATGLPKAAGSPYVTGDPSTGVAGDIVHGDAIEHPQREILDVIETLGGLTPDAGDLTQLRQAIEGYMTALPLMAVRGLETAPAAGLATVAVTLSPGACLAVAGGAGLLRLDAPLTKRMDAAWSAGDGAGGLDTGAVAAGTRYALWLITDDAAGTLDALISESFTAPTAPIGWTARRRIGTLVTDGAGTLRAWVQWGDRIEYDPAQWDATTTVAAAGEATVPLPVPPLPGVEVTLSLDVQPVSGGHENMGVAARPTGASSRGIEAGIDTGTAGLFGTVDGINCTGRLHTLDGAVVLSHPLLDPAIIRVRVQGYVDPRGRGI